MRSLRVHEKPRPVSLYPNKGRGENRKQAANKIEKWNIRE